jgi:hypothetical protein
MAKKPLTVDEVRVILKWAEAYVAEHPDDHSIGLDTLFQRELDRLREKLSEITPGYLLGMVNAGFLLGFDTVEHSYPMQAVWDRITNELGPGLEHERKVLGTMLADAGFIKRSSCRSQTKS